MDVQLQELIDKIKKEGVLSAQAKTQQMLDEAKQKADQIIQEANAKSQELTDQAKADVARLEESGKQTLLQASRDFMLGLRQQMEKFFHALVVKQTGKALSDKALVSAVGEVVKKWKPSELADWEVLLPEDQMKTVAAELQESLSDYLKAGLVLKPVSGLDKGFKVGSKDGDFYYDFSATGMAEMIGTRLNPYLQAILLESAQKES